MQQSITTVVLGGFFLIMALGFPVWARASADETRLESVRQEIDSGASLAAQSDKIQVLSRQFKVEPAVVESLHAHQHGWGETTIELAMAQRLMQTDANTYPTMNDALNKITSLRARKTGWGKIAGDLGFKLGPVVSAAMHARNQLRNENRQAVSVGTAKTGKAEKTGKIDKTVRAEKIGRPEHAVRPDRPARPEKAVRVR